MFGKKFLREFGFKIAVAATMTTAVTTSAIIAKIWTWPNAIVGSVLLLSGTLYLLDRFGIGPSGRSRVRNWLDESGFPIQSVSDGNAIHFVLVDNVGLYTHIIQAKDGDPLSIGMPKLKPSDKQVTVFNAMSAEEKQAFWKKIRFELLRAKIQFSDLNVEEGVLISEQIGLARTLTGVEFLGAVVNVRSAGRLYLEMLNDAFPEDAAEAMKA